MVVLSCLQNRILIIKIMSNMFEGLDFWFEQIIAYCIALVLVQFMKKQI